ncbi:MAG: histone deacetylase [Calditrichaceae bacterium]
MWHFFRKEYAKVVFSSDYIYGLPTSGDHQTFDIMKYKKIRDKLVAKKLLKRRNVLRPDLCSYEDLKLVHTEKYLKSLQDPQNVSQILKLGIVNPWDNFILEYFRAVTGGTLMATAYALKWNKPTFNLGGGYHHAHPDKAEGFCLINDVAIAIQKFRHLHRAKKFMIIDLDYHQGNGNLLYFKDDPDVFTFSMHANTWVEIEGKWNQDILLPQNCDDDTYLDILEQQLSESCMAFRPDAVFYIAGSDPYEKDLLADMKITRKGMLKRNLYVYRKVRKRNIPLIVIAGGGYGADSWEVYYDFIEYCLQNKY